VDELSDQKRGIVFVICALIILFVWQHFYKPAPPVTPPQSAQSSQQNPGAPATGAANNSQTTNAGTSNAPGLKAAGATASGARNAAAVNLTATQAGAEQTLTVNSPLYTVEFSNRGAVVRSWKLNKYFDDQKTPQPLDLVNDAVAQQLGWPFSLVLADAKQEATANAALYEMTATSHAGLAGGQATPVTSATQTVQAPAEIEFHWSDGQLDVKKKITFGDNYELHVTLTVTQDGAPQAAALAWRGGFGDKEAYNAAQSLNVFYNSDSKLNLLPVKKVGVSGNQGQPAIQYGPLAFAGIEDQFFTATFIPETTGNLSLWHWKQDYKPSADKTDPESQMAVGSTTPGPIAMRAYIGPKDLGILEKMTPSLTGLVNFGWMEPVAKPLLWVLQTVHTKVPNWGWCIILMTLVINLALFPLKMKGWRSMQKMQRAGPEIKQIQEKYKKYKMNDPRKSKMNEEVMAVYSREGINPLGSCLPMLAQLPIWWALWRVLNGAIELRHAPWLGWIHDLSAMDPYYILPIAMAALMFLTNRMTPQTTVDPAQQRMMAFMPLMMLFFFYRLSSGLNLYMSTSSIVAIAQQYYLNRTEPLPSRSKFKNKPTDKT
jgi:YidC/Oxa1 family membrane protein insertase